MTERIIDLAEQPARLSIRNSCLVISRADEPETTVPVGEVAVLSLANPQVLLTQPVLAELAAAGAAVLVSDRKHMPAAMLLPLAGHFIQGERFALQARASLPTRKRLWQAIVRAKIRAQARVLAEVRGHDGGLPELVAKVRSGDPGNVEAEAARRYWPALFLNRRFRRDRSASGENRFLNYGYAVLRAIVARGVCAAGLHPSLGLHHHNRYDAFRLVDDLIEPFRPIVDKAVAQYCDAHGSDAPLDKAAKAALINTLMGTFKLGRQKRSLFDIAHRTAASLVAVFAGERRSLLLPEI
ncbi:MAG TPA: type II CRISPR-associated endonuclease Cas1 [Armatimonadota bacterium]|nr:type II CRISPR-associated endonuclease Cas1 [Armatimonadota bacterium]